MSNINIWPKQSECLGLFGNPSEHNFVSKHLVLITPPFFMHMGKIPIKHFYMNKICASSIERILNKAWEICEKNQEKIAKEHFDKFSGSWAVRPMRGKKNTISMHAYGLAIDFHAEKNPLGRKPGGNIQSFTENSLLVKLFKEENWTWGGNWSGRPDGMHFQAARV